MGKTAQRSITRWQDADDTQAPTGDGTDDGRVWAWNHLAGRLIPRNVLDIADAIVARDTISLLVNSGADQEARDKINEIIYLLRTIGLIAPAFTDISATESYALEDFFNATNGTGWTNNTGWPGRAGYTGLAADAVGVTVSGGVVTGLTLSSNALSGQYPAAGLPGGLVNLYLNNNAGMELSGSWADFSSTVVWIHLASSASTVAGNLADLPSNTKYVYAYTPITFCRLSGGPDPISCVGIRAIRFDGSSAQTAADNKDLLARIDADRFLFTFSTPSLDISSTHPVDADDEAIITRLTSAEAGRTAVWAITYDPPA